MSPDRTQISLPSPPAEHDDLDLAPPAIAEAVRTRLAVYFTRRASLGLPDYRADATQAALYWGRARRPDLVEALQPYQGESAATQEDLAFLASLANRTSNAPTPILARIRFLEGQRSYDGEPLLGIFTDGSSRFLGLWTHVAHLPDWAYAFTFVPLTAILEEAMRFDWISPTELLATADTPECHFLTLLGDVWERAVSPPPREPSTERGKSWALITSAA